MGQYIRNVNFNPCKAKNIYNFHSPFPAYANYISLSLMTMHIDLDLWKVS